MGGAFGRGFDAIVRDAYLNLSTNWIPGDEIYLFGFSRGAYIVRVLANIICKYGLLTRWASRRDDDPNTADEFSIRRWVKKNLGKSSPETPVQQEPTPQTETPKQKPFPPWLRHLYDSSHYCGYYKDTDNPPLRIQCVGLWDTVGSLGPITGRYARKYYDTDIYKQVEYCFHAYGPI
jgi:uncharacterized protein (DUF2235 family)